jgi:dTDP-4-dehydrorhamnose 3,5-epimerase
VNFRETGLPGAFIVDIEPLTDHRGFFARIWSQTDAREHGIEVDFVQSNLSNNRSRGTLRGMHYQYPNWEPKLVRVTRGSIFDVIVDLRPDSPTRNRHFAVELTAQNRRAIYAPAGFAHGFLTLEDDTDVLYQMGEYYIPGQDHGFRWDDPQFNIPWPPGEKILSSRDQNLPLYAPWR